jgi:uncharacterized membrane-anchored protein YjiN (DUF445 family)
MPADATTLLVQVRVCAAPRRRPAPRRSSGAIAEAEARRHNDSSPSCDPIGSQDGLVAKPLPFRYDQRMTINKFRRTRAIATLLLALMAIVFLLSWHFAALHPTLPYVRAFSEAALIGGLADWFAITALFNRPFGLPIPHTAIIPRNKRRIGRGLGDFLTATLLNRDSLAALLGRLDLPRQAGHWLKEADHAELLADWLLAQGPSLVTWWRGVNGPAKLESLLADLPLAPFLAMVVARSAEQGTHQVAITAAARGLAGFLEERRTEIKQKLSLHSSRWIPGWVDDRLADRVSDALIGLLVELQSPSHRWRQSLDALLVDLPERLRHHPDWQSDIERWQHTLLASAELQQDLQRMMTALAGSVGLDREPLAGLLRRVGDLLAEDPIWQQRLDDLVQALSERLLLPRKHAIGDFVADQVAGWDDAALITKLEGEVGADLHYIRLNGTLVGGLVGLILFAVTTWLS